VAQFLQQLVTGISIGGIYALLAVGYALIFSIFDFTNFAFGSLMMLGAYAGFFTITLLGLSVWWSVALAIICVALISVFVERIAYRPLRQRGAPRLFLMITAMGVDLFLVNLVTVVIGGAFRPYPGITRQAVVQLGFIRVGALDILAAVVSFVALAALWYFIDRTKSGLAIRASAYDTTTAGLMGISVNRVAFIVFFISGIISAIAGVFFGIKYAVYPMLGGISNKAFIASVIGGLGSLPGAVVGGLVLGVLETMVSGYISSVYRDLFSFSLLVLTLLFLPFGLMGKRVQDKL
jgi:branched-chain amino acid transport system permease protein